jgi:tetratricopeptide (TPR) repeat protein
MNHLALVLVFAALSAYSQPPALPAGTHSADAPQTVTPVTPNSLDAAEDAMVKRDWNAALGLLQKHLATNPPSPEAARAQYDIGFCDEALEKPDDAAEAYRKAIAADAKQFEAHAALGRLLVEQGKTAEGRAELVSASNLSPAAGDANAAKAEVYRALAKIDRRDNPPQASAELIEALKLTPETLGDTLLSAEIAENSGDLPGAEAAYRKAAVSAPDSVQASASLAHLLIKEKKYADALPFAEHVHAAVPDDAEVTHLLANLYLETGDAEKADALEAALIATAEGSKDPALYISRGESLLRQHDYAGAQAAYQHAADLDSKLVDAWSGLAFAASENHQYPIALQALTMRSKLEPDPPAALFLWGTTYDNLHQYKSAMAYYKRFLTAAKGNFPDQEFEARHRLLALERMH